MADYNVTSSDGTFLVTVQTGTINNQFDIPFIGQDAINYGDDLVAAQLRQLENFSSQIEPAFGTARVKGQLWYDSTPSTGRLNIFDGSSFAKIPLDIDVVHTSGAESIADVKTFSSAPVFSAAGAPITVNSNTLVPNLNADFLDGLHATAFADAAQGVLADGAEQALPLNTAGNGFVLTTDIAAPDNVYTWTSPAVSAGQIILNTMSTLDTTTNVMLAGDEAATSGGTLQDPLYATGLTYNAATSRLTTLEFGGTFFGSLTGNADTATTATTATVATNIDINATTSTDTTTYLVLVGAVGTGNQLPFIDNVDLSYNASTGALSSVSFVGDGSLITTLNLSSGTHTGTLAVARGGTGVTTSTGTGSAFALHNSPVFVTEITTPRIAAASDVVIEYSGSGMIQTQDRAATGNTSGGQIRAHSNVFEDIGFNTLPQFNFSTNDVAQARHVGHATGQTSGTNTLTTPASGDLDFPVDGITTIINAHTGDYTVAEGSGVTLSYLEPGVGLSDTGGTASIGGGGVATLYRKDATNFWIWGSEISY